MRSYEFRSSARNMVRMRRISATLLALTLAASTGCNNLLAVDNPGSVPDEALGDAGLVPILEAGSIQTFQCGLAAFIATGGMLSGEYLSANAFVNNHPWEWRGNPEIRNEPGNCTNVTRASTFMGFYTPLQQARFQLDDAYTRANGFTDAQVPGRTRILAEMRAYAGYAYLLLGEGMCDMTIDGGPRMTREQVWAIAEQRFTDAIGLAGGVDSLRYLAIAGRARARLDLKNLAGAAADAAAIPTTFVYRARYSETTQTRENRLYNLTVRNDFLSVGPDYRGLTVGTQADPRVRVTNMNRKGSDNVTDIWQQQKFTGSGAVALPIASWNEAQLILAEAVGGQAGIDAINRVRAANGVTTPLVADPASDITPLVLEERRRQLFSEGQRYADMLRKGLPFTMGVNGVNRKSQVFGTVTCVPLPDIETQNNPNLKT